MLTLLGIVVILPVLTMALLVSLSDFVLPNRRRRRQPVAVSGPESHDFRVLVPIYGSTRYLENLDYLASYGSRVWFCTTTGESEEFYAALGAIAAAGRHRVVRIAVPGRGDGSDQRATTAPIRDELIAAVAEMIPSRYAVMLDADTTTELSLDRIVGEAAERGLDVASVRVEPPRGGTLLQRLQGLEYLASMDVRRALPWLLSGAFHVFSADALRTVMRAHSRFFQGNDVEAGALAHLMGLRAGHLQTIAFTSVPSGWHAWWRQRLAWSGGVFRLTFINVKLGRIAPLLVLYLLWVYLLWPVRIWLLVTRPEMIVYVCLVNWALWLLLYFPRRSWALLALPFYGMVQSLVLVPAGAWAYAQMVLRHHQWGLISTDRVNRNGLAYAPEPVQRQMRQTAVSSVPEQRWQGVTLPV
jgi:hypothetical protein